MTDNKRAFYEDVLNNKATFTDKEMIIGTGKTDTHPVLSMNTANLMYRGTAFRGIFISDKIFLVADNGENTHVKEWLKSVIKEAVEEVMRGE